MKINRSHAGSFGNILDIYAQATPDEIMSGMIWYRDAHDWCGLLQNHANRLADSVKAVDLCDVANVVALLSPRSKWERNKKDAEALLMAYATCTPMESVVIATFKANKTKAINYLQASTAYEKNVIMAGAGEAKVPSFAHNIHSYATSRHVTVDGHAIGVWLGCRAVNGYAAGPAYARIQADYQEAAAEVGILPHQMQAITWIVYRRIHKVK